MSNDPSDGWKLMTVKFFETSLVDEIDSLEVQMFWLFLSEVNNLNLLSKP